MDGYREEINRILNERWPEDQVLLVIGNPAIQDVIALTLLLEGGYGPILAATLSSLFEPGAVQQSAILVLDLDLIEQEGYVPAAFLSQAREWWAASSQIVALTSRRTANPEVRTQARLLYKPFRLRELLGALHAAATSLRATA